MDMPDLNHTLLLIIAVLVSLTRLVRLLFLTLRVCVKEYRKFRNWLHNVRSPTATALQKTAPGINAPQLSGRPVDQEPAPEEAALHAGAGERERDHEREKRHQWADEEGAGHHTFKRRVVPVRGQAGHEQPTGCRAADVRRERYDERDAEPSHHVTPDASRPLAPTAVQR